jgi:CheY-like chemotaxis protein
MPKPLDDPGGDSYGRAHRRNICSRSRRKNEHNYQVEYKNNLTDLSWTPLSRPIAANGAIQSASDSTVGRIMRCYGVHVSIEGRVNRKSYSLLDVILSDINLPRFRGFEFLRWLRQQAPEHTRLILAIIISALEQARAFGARMFVLKPVNWAEFCQELFTKGLLKTNKLLRVVTQDSSGFLFACLFTKRCHSPHCEFSRVFWHAQQPDTA